MRRETYFIKSCLWRAKAIDIRFSLIQKETDFGIKRALEKKELNIIIIIIIIIRYHRRRHTTLIRLKIYIVVV